MAVTADSVVVELQAKIDKYEADMKRAAATTDGAMKGVASSTAQADAAINRLGANAENSLSRTQNATRNLGRQISDIGTGLATGQNPFFIIAQQSGQVADALADTGGRAARVAAFFAGPWGAALLAAGSALGILLGKAMETGDSIEDLADGLQKSADKAYKAEQAQAIFENTLDGVEKALRDNKEAQDKLTGAQDTGAEATLRSAQAERKRLVEIRKVILALAEQAEAEYAAARAQTFGAAGGAGAGIAQSIYAGRAKAADDLVKRAEKALEEAKRQEEVGRSLVIVERARADQAEKTNRIYDQKVEKARQEAVARGKVGAALDAEIKKIEAARKADLKRISDREAAERKASTSRTAENGRKLTVQQATAIVQGVGGTVTSGQRSTATQQRLYDAYRAGTGPLAAKPGSSYHEKGQAVDVRKSPGVTLEKLKAAFQAKGVRILEALDEGTHYHIAFAGFGKEIADQAREQERAAREATRNADRYADTLGTLDEKIAQLGAKQLVEIEDQIAAAKDASDAERAKRDAAYERQARDGEITEKQLEELKFRSSYINALERLAITMDGKAKIEQEELAKAGAAVDLRRAALEAEKAQTDSGKRKLEIDRQLIELKYQELIAAQERIIADKNASEAAKKIAELRIEQLKLEKGTEVFANTEASKGPLQSYVDNLNKEGGSEQIGARVEELVVQELDYVRNSITKALTKQLGIKDPFLAGIMDMLVQQLIIKPLAEALSKAGSEGGGILGVISSIGSAIGSLFGARASGGNVQGGGAYLVGERGPELFAPAQSGKIYPTGSLKMANAGQMGGSGGQTIIVDAKGAVMNDQFASMILARAKQMDIEAGKITYRQSMKDAPGAVAQKQRYG